MISSPCKSCQKENLPHCSDSCKILRALQSELIHRNLHIDRPISAGGDSMESHQLNIVEGVARSM